MTIDECGNPLDVGREQRLFTPRQRIGLAIRDGGCRWQGCDRPASYCEAHHIDEWKKDQGHTDIDRGILLCRFHHMNLHNREWKITRRAKDDFILHAASGEKWAMRTRTVLSYAFADIDPPPKRFRPTG
ncbi:HNH endonuclease signature motif containing protein [Microbacterium sp.]|uniref:HNH endonuclease signature motif containing protein n=1 Tax=Microbacterium sp. TaxID=51671 RepID=UPI003A8E3CFC